MAEGRRRDAWDHTASLMALTVNSNPYRKHGTRPANLADFHPFQNQRRNRRRSVSVEQLAEDIMRIAARKP